MICLVYIYHEYVNVRGAYVLSLLSLLRKIYGLFFCWADGFPFFLRVWRCFPCIVEFFMGDARAWLGLLPDVVMCYGAHIKKVVSRFFVFFCGKRRLVLFVVKGALFCRVGTLS